MFPELSEDIFYVVLIDQEISQHDIIWGTMVFHTVKKILLVFERDLGIRYQDRRDKGMGMLAFQAQNALYNEGHET